jgi:hypothetical protein
VYCVCVCVALLKYAVVVVEGERASYDHKPHDPIEEARVVKAGGHVTKVVNKGVVTARVVGTLSLLSISSIVVVVVVVVVILC